MVTVPVVVLPLLVLIGAAAGGMLAARAVRVPVSVLVREWADRAADALESFGDTPLPAPCRARPRRPRHH